MQIEEHEMEGAPATPGAPWRCAWCDCECSHSPKPGTFGVVCARCATDGPPNAGAFEDE
jgi:hypothetical protein